MDVIRRLRYGYLRLAPAGPHQRAACLSAYGHAAWVQRPSSFLGGQALNGRTSSPAGFAKEYPIVFCIPARHDYTRHHVDLQDCGMTPLS